MKKYWQSFLTLIYPDLCYGCDTSLVEGEDKLCLRCYRDLPVIDYHKQMTNPMLQLVTHLAKVKDAYCFLKFNKDGMAQKMLHELKYRDHFSMGETLGSWFGKYFSNEISDKQIDFIVPMPMHKHKKRERGYNQSEVIAKGVRKVTSIPILNDIIIRTKNITSQTKKNKIDRWENTKSIYAIKNEEKLAGKNILLLDDVITTGATVVSALEVLSGTSVNNLYFGCIASGK